VQAVGVHPPLVTEDFPIAVCWSPKSGCTTMLRWFLFQTGLLEESEAHHWWPHLYRMNVLCVRPGYHRLCQQVLAERTKFVIKVVRDPARRAVSNFLHLLTQAVDMPHDPGWQAVQAWRRDVGMQGERSISFEQFMLYLVSPRRPGAFFDLHLAPQWCAGQDPAVELLIPLEHLTPHLRDLERRFSLEAAPLERLSQSVHHHPAAAGHGWPDEAARLAVEPEALRTLGAPPPKIFLDDCMRQLIRTAYHEDYAAYGHLYDGVKAAAA
jgi:hypothetical protein